MSAIWVNQGPFQTLILKINRLDPGFIEFDARYFSKPTTNNLKDNCATSQ